MSASANEQRRQSKTRAGKKGGEQSDHPVRVNKTLEIRKEARKLVSEGKPPRPTEIVERLKPRGIVVTSAQVSTALTNTEFAFRRNRADWEQPHIVFLDPAMAFGQVSLDDVLEARAFVDRLGSVEKAMAALVAYKQFGGTVSKERERVYPDSVLDRKASPKAVE